MLIDGRIDDKSTSYTKESAWAFVLVNGCQRASDRGGDCADTIECIINSKQNKIACFIKILVDISFPIYFFIVYVLNRFEHNRLIGFATSLTHTDKRGYCDVLGLIYTERAVIKIPHRIGAMHMKKGKINFGILLIVGLLVLMQIQPHVDAQTAPEETPTPEVTATPETDIPMPTDADDIPDGWLLLWNDEFSGTEINKQNWFYDTGGNGFGNNELQYYTDDPKNSYVEDGNLVIQALEEDYLGMHYTSAKLRTMVLQEWMYGRIDIRAKLSYGQGLWPAFWMLPARSTYGSWPHSGEIDIMEHLGHQPETVYGTLHYSSSTGHQYTGSSYTLSEGTFSDDFHTFTLIWEPERIQWYVDGMLYQEQTEWQTRNGEHPAPFNHQFYLIINLAVGGNWPGNPDETTTFPQSIMVDYVRVYQTEAMQGE